jgi:hypothetical protein
MATPLTVFYNNYNYNIIMPKNEMREGEREREKFFLPQETSLAMHYTLYTHPPLSISHCPKIKYPFLPPPPPPPPINHVLSNPLKFLIPF